MRARGVVVSVLAAVALGYGIGGQSSASADAKPVPATAAAAAVAAKPKPKTKPKPVAIMPLAEWRAVLKSDGWTRMAPNPFPKHGECWAIMPDGDTAVVVCRDGFTAVS
jgi:hypothetical protein